MELKKKSKIKKQTVMGDIRDLRQKGKTEGKTITEN